MSTRLGARCWTILHTSSMRSCEGTTRSLVSQLDAFKAFLADPAQAATPLGRWTATILADPEKRTKHRLATAVRIGGAEVYNEAAADALEAAMRPFVEDGTVLRLSRHESRELADPDRIFASERLLYALISSQNTAPRRADETVERNQIGRPDHPVRRSALREADIELLLA